MDWFLYDNGLRHERVKGSIYCNLGKQTELFQDREGFVELGHLDKQFVKNTRKKGPAG